MILRLFNLSRPTADGLERSAPEGGILHFLLEIFGFTGGVMDPNGTTDPH